MYRKFIEEHFGNVHLKGFECMVDACELYAAGCPGISVIYHEVADKHKTSPGCIERNIRHYISYLNEDTIRRCLPAMNKPTNLAVIAAIVYEVNKEANHE